jgi:hypothetical protein
MQQVDESMWVRAFWCWRRLARLVCNQMVPRVLACFGLLARRRAISLQSACRRAASGVPNWPGDSES